MSRDAGSGRWVVKVSGRALEEPSAHRALWRSIASASSDGGQIVVVHGGGLAVDAHLERLGFVSERIGGLRCTPADQLLEIVGVLGGRVNKTLVSALIGAGSRGVGLSLVDGGGIRCSRVEASEGDLGRVGEIVGGDAGLLEMLLVGEYVPVVASIGGDGDGLLNINGDDAAGGLAMLLDAEGVVFLSDVAGVRGGDGTIIGELDGEGCEALIGDGTISDGMIAKVRAAARCAQRSGRAVVIASYREDDVVRQVMRGESVGTRIVASARAGGRGGA